MSDEDPFEELEEDVEGREGDPFDALEAHGERGEESPGGPEQRAEDPLGEPGEPQGEAPAEEGADDASRSPWGEPLEPDTTDERAGTPVTPEGAEGSQTVEPERELDVGSESGVGEQADVGTVGGREGDPFEAMGDAFTEMDVEGVQPDEVWEQLTDAQSRGSVHEHQSRTYAEVSKHSYCEQCEHFSEPPAVSCSNEGTEIVEFLNVETVRVVDCPIVAERKELEGE